MSATLTLIPAEHEPISPDYIEEMVDTATPLGVPVEAGTPLKLASATGVTPPIIAAETAITFGGQPLTFSSLGVYSFSGSGRDTRLFGWHTYAQWNPDDDSRLVVDIADSVNHRIVRRMVDDRMTPVTAFLSSVLASVYGIAGPESGYVYVADTDHHNVLKCTWPDYQVVATLGTSTGGNGSGQFYYPRGLALHGGHLYVADCYNHRIKKIRLDTLTTVTMYGSYGSGDGQFAYPSGIAVTDDYVYVSDQQNNRIVRLDPDTLAWEDKFGTYGGADTQFYNPWGLAVHDGLLYVADYNNHRIVVYTADLEFVRKIGSLGAGLDQFNQPVGVAVRGDRLFVGDKSNNRVHVRVAPGLEALGTWGTFGGGATQFYWPSEMIVWTVTEPLPLGQPVCISGDVDLQASGASWPVHRVARFSAQTGCFPRIPTAVLEETATTLGAFYRICWRGLTRGVVLGSPESDYFVRAGDPIFITSTGGTVPAYFLSVGCSAYTMPAGHLCGVALAGGQHAPGLLPIEFWPYGLFKIPAAGWRIY